MSIQSITTGDCSWGMSVDMAKGINMVILLAEGKSLGGEWASASAGDIRNSV